MWAEVVRESFTDDTRLKLILKFIPSFSCHLLSTYHVSCTVLGTGNKKVIDTFPCFLYRVYYLV